jgi:outer membrane protein W
LGFCIFKNILQFTSVEMFLAFGMNKKILLILLLLFNFPILCQYNGYEISIGIYGVYTTSASLFLNPNAPDIVLRNQSYDIEDIFNLGGDIRYRISEPVILGLNIEYINITERAPNYNDISGSSVVSLDVEDGFNLIPVELTAYYLLPFSSEQFKFLMGGGIAYYNGEFLRKIGDAEVTNISKEAAFGIHVSVSMDYIPLSNVVTRFQMKFRDPQFTVTSKYNRQEVIYQGQRITLREESFDTKINMDGITFMIGIAYQF